MVQVQHLEWLAHYMVLRRISIEPNYHNLYVAYVELHRDGELPLKVLSETYRNIKVRDKIHNSARMNFYLCLFAIAGSAACRQRGRKFL